MKKPIFYSIIISLVFLVSLQKMHGQDTLPSFSVIERSGKIIIGWINPNPELKQIIIQRSFDSSKGFRSIISMPDPSAYTNGYLDKPSDSASYYYRLFCTKPGGTYFFTETKKAIKEKIKTITYEEAAVLKSISSEEFVLNATTRQKIQLVKQNYRLISKTQDGRFFFTESQKASKEKTKMITSEESSVLNSISPEEFLLNATNRQKIQLAKHSGNIIDPGKMDKTIKKDSVINENIFQPSGLIFTDAESNLIIVLPDPEKKNFSLFVYQEDGEIVFRMKNIKESKLLIDKSNFISSGWFKYELFEGQKSREKNKFFIPPQNK
jgi:hypothetical protein